ncbi:MAG TPA: TolC family protein [Terriglobales bacterium]|nr:TolC family protein [Terriglobales bacterium]
MKSMRFVIHATCVLLVAALPTFAQEPLTFRRAIELAIGQSTEMALSQSDEARARDSYREARNSYIPQAAIGSDVGYAYGFPLSLEGSAPTLFNVVTQSSVWNPAQREFIKAAKAEWGVSKAQTRDQRMQVVTETALTYIELNQWEQRLPILQSEMKVVHDVEAAVSERINAGVDSPLEATKAKLTDAQTRVHMAEASGAIDVLRTRLSQLTGMPAQSITTARDSIPALQETAAGPEVAARASESSTAVEIAQGAAVAREFRAKGEHKALYPTADFAAQYGLINTSLTNFEQFFVPGSFQPHNVTFGVVLRLPFLNASQHAHAEVADAEALRSRKEAEQTRNRAALDALKLQHNVEQLRAARDVAQLRSELAQNQLDAVQTRMQAETATQRELQDAAIEAAERSLDRINAEFQLQAAQVQLYRATGDLQQWAIGK